MFIVRNHALDVMEISHSSWPWHRSDATALAGYLREHDDNDDDDDVYCGCVNSEDSTGSDIDGSSAAGALQDRRHNQLEGLLGGVRVGRPRRPARSARHQPATHRHRVHVAGRRAPLQDQVGRRQRRTSHEEDHPRPQSTETATLLHPTLTPPQRRTCGFVLVQLLDPRGGSRISRRGRGLTVPQSHLGIPEQS